MEALTERAVEDLLRLGTEVMAARCRERRGMLDQVVLMAELMETVEELDFLVAGVDVLVEQVRMEVVELVAGIMVIMVELAGMDM